jgi:hypothetical protein
VTQQQDSNPFAPYERVPSVSFKGAPIGGSLTMTVVELPKEVQARDFATGKQETWDNGDPKMNVVTRVELNGEKRDLYCTKPSAMYNAIVECLKQTMPGYLDVGGTLTITFTGEQPSSKGNPQKLYAAQYRPPSAFGNGAQQQAPSSWQQQQQQGPPEPPPSSWQQPTQQPTQQAAQQPSSSPWGQPAQQQSDEPPF